MFCLFEGAFLVAFSFCIRLLNARIENTPAMRDPSGQAGGSEHGGVTPLDFFKHAVFPAPGSHHTDPHGDLFVTR